MKRSVFFVSAVLASATAAAAFPADAADWTGFHIGVGGGVQHVHSRMSEGADAAGSNALYGCDLSQMCSQDFFTAGADASHGVGKTSAFGTIEGGYDFQFSNIVAGFLADYNFGKSSLRSHADGSWSTGTNSVDNSGSSPSVTDSSTVDGGPASVRQSLSLRNSWDLGARLGFVAMPRLMVYTAGGYSRVKLREAAVGTLGAGENVLTSDESFNTSQSKWKAGWFLGAGVETLLGHHISGKLEYRYARYGSIGMSENDVPFTVVDPNGNITGTASGGAEAHNINNQSLRAVVSYRF